MKKLFLSLAVCSAAAISSCGDSDEAKDEAAKDEIAKGEAAKGEEVDVVELMRLVRTSCYLEIKDAAFREDLQKAVDILKEKIIAEPDNAGPKLFLTWAYRMLGENRNAYEIGQSMLELINENEEIVVFTKQMITEEHAINCLLLNKAEEAKIYINSSIQYREELLKQDEGKLGADSEEWAVLQLDFRAKMFLLKAIELIAHGEYRSAIKRVGFPIVRRSPYKEEAEFLEGFIDDVESGKRKLDFIK